MGPRSTAPFVDMVVTECQKQYGAHNVEDFPHMFIYTLPDPFFIDRPIDHERACSAVKAGLKRLEGAGVAFITMPCNTAPVYYEQLAAGRSSALSRKPATPCSSSGASQSVPLRPRLIQASISPASARWARKLSAPNLFKTKSPH